MIHQQTETRHLFHAQPPNTASLIDDDNLVTHFIHWLETHASEEDLKKAMDKALPAWSHNFIHVFTGKDTHTAMRYIAVSWQETPDRQAICFGEKRPDHVEKYTVKGAPSYMLNAETIAALVTMLPQGKR